MHIQFDTETEVEVLAELTKLFDNDSVDFNTIKYQKNHLLHHACNNGWKDVVNLLLQHPLCDVNKRNDNNQTPLSCAYNKKQMDITRILLEDTNCIIGKHSLHEICKTGNIPMLKLFLNDSRVDINYDGNFETKNIMFRCGTPLHMACRFNQIDVVRILLEDNRLQHDTADTNGYTPFHLACQKRNPELVKLFLENPLCNPNGVTNKYETGFYIACKTKDYDIIKLLLEYSSYNLNLKPRNGVTPLYQLCFDHRDDEGDWFSPDSSADDVMKSIKLLLSDERIDPTANQESAKEEEHYGFKKTVFHEACSRKNIPLIKLFLEDGRCDPNEEETHQYDNSTPFFKACQDGSIEVVEILSMDPRVDPNKSNWMETTPLEVACNCKRFEVVKYLLSHYGNDIVIPTKVFSDEIEEILRPFR